MKILTVLTYYRPHTSGLTIYAERLARAFVKRGHEVTVMTSQYEKSVPREVMMDVSIRGGMGLTRRKPTLANQKSEPRLMLESFLRKAIRLMDARIWLATSGSGAMTGSRRMNISKGRERR